MTGPGMIVFVNMPAIASPSAVVETARATTGFKPGAIRTF
jgi:hypothetical protein